MVLMRALPPRGVALSVTAVLSALLATPAEAQSAVEDTGLLNPLVREYRPIGVRLGSVTVFPELDVNLAHDSNIYAEADNEKDDRILSLTPRALAEMEHGNWRFRGLGQLHARRYFNYDTENRTSGILEGDVRFSRRQGEAFRAALGYRRVVEDRGDPEANVNVPERPRRANLLRGELGYRRELGAWLLGVGGIATKLNQVAEEDKIRDHLSLAGQARVGRRVGGLSFATVTAFVNRRKFDRRLDEQGFERDATTYGARAGLEINPGGVFEGGASVGLFRFNADDPRIEDYTGVSAAADLVYRPTQRTAILFDLARGNVATYRGGATARTDFRWRAALQQEIRHNLFGRVSAFQQQSKFRGSGLKENTLGADAELEYLLTRYLSVAPRVRYSTRQADQEEDEFDRFRASMDLRFHL